MGSETITDSIRDALTRIEEENQVTVLLAVESGSRAWGFPSVDSDYDVRFVYARHPRWYLSIDLEERSDVIELPITGPLDLSGWDIRKALKLFRKSNPPLLEWLQSSIIYRERSSFATRLRAYLPQYYSPMASFHHYLHMARGNVREYLKGDTVWRKKYLYVLRPLLAMLWLEQGRGPVPIEFSALLEATIHESSVRQAIEALVAEKRAGAELDRGPRIAEISDFIERELPRLEGRTAAQHGVPVPMEVLNDLFHSTLRELWANECPA